MFIQVLNMNIKQHDSRQYNDMMAHLTQGINVSSQNNRWNNTINNTTAKWPSMESNLDENIKCGIT